MAADEWPDLMAAALRGDSRRYHRLLTELRAWLSRYFSRRLPPSVVDDAIQETLIAIHEKRATYDPKRPFGPWLAAIARYKWIDRLRAMKRAPGEPLDDDLAVEDHEAAVVSATVLERLLSTLKPAQAECIRLVKIRGFSVEEASAATGQSVSLVKINIHRGLARLVRTLESQEEAGG
jgi:RNA polymerase sigma-70 factor (ECF subfamily)